MPPITTVGQARRACPVFPANPQSTYWVDAPCGDDPDSRKGYWVGEGHSRLQWAGWSFDGRYGRRGSPYTWWRLSSLPDGTDLLLEQVGIGTWKRGSPPDAGDLARIFAGAEVG